MKGAAMLKTLHCLGITSSFSCPRDTSGAETILEHRKQVYQEAERHNPKPWSGNIRSWVLPEKVWLNPKEEQLDVNKAA